MQPISCPTTDRLRSLLDGTLSPEESATLTSHLETCDRCPAELEALVAGTESWSGTAHQLGGERPAFESALQEAMASLKGEAEESGTDGRMAAEDDRDLSFLTPADKPGLLGKLAHYEVSEVIGRGGNGIVLKAFDPVLSRFVAIKVLAPRLATSAAARRRFAREAQAAAAVIHEHVISIHAVEEVSGLPYLVMGYVSGCSLQERLDQSGPMPVEKTLRIGMQTAAGLAAAHAQGLIHRDIKPANILLENCIERVKITDFGLARAVDDASLTQTGVVTGTPQYMAPEQARGEALDHRADLFSLGSVLYTMCTGRVPFRASTTLAVLKRVCEDTPRAIPEINPEIPDWLTEIIAKLQAKNSAERFQTAHEVADLLGQHLAHLQQPTRVPAPPRLATSTTCRLAPIELHAGAKGQAAWIRRPNRLAVAAVVFLVLAGLVISENTGFTEVSKFLATVLRIRTPDGTLVVEIDDPQVKVAVDGEDEVVISGAGAHEIRLRPGRHQVRATKGDTQVYEEFVTVTRGGKQVVRVTRESRQLATPQVPRAPLHGDVNDPLLRREVDVTPFNPNIERRFSQPAVTRLQPLVFRRHVQPVWTTAFSPNDRRIASVSGIWNDEMGELIIWDVKNGKVWGNQTEPRGLRCVVYSRDGKQLVTGGYDGMLKFRDPITGEARFILKAHDGLGVNSVAFSPDGKLLATGGLDSRIKLWDLGTHQEVGFFPNQSDWVLSVAFSPDGKILATALHDQSGVKLWDVETRQLIATLKRHTNQVEHLAFSPDGSTLATAGWDGSVKLWDLRTHREVASLDHHPGAVWSVAFSPDGKWLATAAGQDLPTKQAPIVPGVTRIYDVASRQLIATLAGQQGQNVSAVFSHNGEYLATASWDKTVVLWDLETVIRRLLAFPKEPRANLDGYTPPGRVLNLDSGVDPNVRPGTQTPLQITPGSIGPPANHVPVPNAGSVLPPPGVPASGSNNRLPPTSSPPAVNSASSPRGS